MTRTFELCRYQQGFLHFQQEKDEYGTVRATADVERMARSRLRSMRTARGYSLDEVAARTNLSASTISRVETG